ncbi:hypothetical protein BH18CHL2_BH18CHL2_12500 [soil metagenome]
MAKRSGRREARRTAERTLRLRSLTRLRSFVGLAGFVPLLAALLCGGAAHFFCVVPREWYLALWAAIFGTFIGLTIRLSRERRSLREGR